MTSPRNISMYLSTKPSSFQELFYTHLACDFIHSIDFSGGTLYCIGHSNPSKSQHTLENVLKSIESKLEQETGTSNFQVISNDSSKKVKTFTHGQHGSDEHYRAIFISTTTGGRGEKKMQPNVKTWRPHRDATNCEVQPKAPKRKRVVAAVPDTGNELNGTVDGPMVEPGSQVTHIACIDI